MTGLLKSNRIYWQGSLHKIYQQVCELKY